MKFWLVLNHTLSERCDFFVNYFFFEIQDHLVSQNRMVLYFFFSVTWKFSHMNERATSMPQHTKKALLKRNPSWKDKPRYGDDDTLRTFKWPYGTGELVDELKRVREILTVAHTIQPNEAIKPIEIDIAFEECFIDSHEN